MIQTSASTTATKYGNLNFVQQKDTSPMSTSIFMKNLDRRSDVSGGLHRASGRTQNVCEQELVVIGISLDHLSRSTQLLICCSGVFFFYLVYGYVQVFLHRLLYFLQVAGAICIEKYFICNHGVVLIKSSQKQLLRCKTALQDVVKSFEQPTQVLISEISYNKLSALL